MRKLLFLTVLFLLIVQPISAQELLQLDELTSGELTTAAPTAAYFVALKSGQALHLQIVAASTGLIPQATLEHRDRRAGAVVPQSGQQPEPRSRFQRQRRRHLPAGRLRRERQHGQIRPAVTGDHAARTRRDALAGRADGGHAEPERDGRLRARRRPGVAADPERHHDRSASQLDRATAQRHRRGRRLV